MKPITSLFDLFNKAKTDKRYKQLAILAYAEHICRDACDCNFGLAKAWINSWAKRNVGGLRNTTCERMVVYLNDLRERIERVE